MYFYSIFAVALMINRRLAPVVSALILMVLFVLIRLSGNIVGPLKFYSNPLVFEFVFGVLCFYVWKAMGSAKIVVGGMGKVSLIALLFASIILLPAGERITVVLAVPRWLAIGIPAVA